MAAGRRAGLPITEEYAWRWLSMNPAKAIAEVKKMMVARQV